MKRGKFKYIIKRTGKVFLIAILSVFLYQIFMELKESPQEEKIYGTKISANEDEEEVKDISTIIENSSACVVGVSKIKNIGSTALLSEAAESLGLGTGIVVSSQGYILTNQHVVGDGNKNCYITVQTGEIYSGKILWTNSDIDLAIVKVDINFDNVAKLGNSNSVKAGEKVYAIGNPIGYEFQRTVTGGIISAINRTVKIKNDDETYSYMTNLIQTDATINPGNSGGPLIDEDGKVIGINTIKITSAEGIGFAIPINIVIPIIEKFESTGEFEEPYLGILAYDGSIMGYVNKNNRLLEGVYIEQIVEDGPASKTELKKGDVIIKIDNTNISKMSELQEYIFSKNPGDQITLMFYRNNIIKEIKVVLGEK